MVKWIEDVSLCDIWYLTYSWVDKFKLKVKNIFNIVNQQTSHICEKKDLQPSGIQLGPWGYGPN